MDKFWKRINPVHFPESGMSVEVKYNGKKMVGIIAHAMKNHPDTIFVTLDNGKTMPFNVTELEEALPF